MEQVVMFLTQYIKLILKSTINRYFLVRQVQFSTLSHEQTQKTSDGKRVDNFIYAETENGRCLILLSLVLWSVSERLNCCCCWQKFLLDNSWKTLVEPSVQLMRRCLPRTPLPLSKDESAYTFPLPGLSVCGGEAASGRNMTYIYDIYRCVCLLLFYRLLPCLLVSTFPVENSEESDEEQTSQDTDKDYVSYQVNQF